MRSLALLIVGAAAQGNSTDYPPGWNGLVKSPPMGWRSWNAFGPGITNATFVAAIDAITAKLWEVDGKMVSLADVGYLRVGIDEGWENCSGPDPNNGLRQHDEAGFPMVNTDKFPDLKWLVDYGHAKVRACRRGKSPGAKAGDSQRAAPAVNFGCRVVRVAVSTQRNSRA